MAKFLGRAREVNSNPDEVIREEPLSEAEARQRVGEFYAQAKLRSGVTIPQLESYLSGVERPDETPTILQIPEVLPELRNSVMGTERPIDEV
jgi:hypothetical protein